jgi:hypothetical protein
MTEPLMKLDGLTKAYPGVVANSDFSQNYLRIG